MSLRDEIAARLAEIIASRFLRAGLEENAQDVRKDAARLMADECIRQMEWARRIVLDEWADDEGYPHTGSGDINSAHTPEVIAEAYADWDKHHPLMLAPEDWKP